MMKQRLWWCVMRIHSRAVRRATELAEKFPDKHGGDRGNQHIGGKFSNTKLGKSRRQILLETGWTDWEIKQMGDIAALSENEFEDMVEGIGSIIFQVLFD